jgi:hypothetical protein
MGVDFPAGKYCRATARKSHISRFGRTLHNTLHERPSAVHGRPSAVHGQSMDSPWRISAKRVY